MRANEDKIIHGLLVGRKLLSLGLVISLFNFPNPSFAAAEANIAFNDFGQPVHSLSMTDQLFQGSSNSEDQTRPHSSGTNFFQNGPIAVAEEESNFIEGNTSLLENEDLESSPPVGQNESNASFPSERKSAASPKLLSNGLERNFYTLGRSLVLNSFMTKSGASQRNTKLETLSQNSDINRSKVLDILQVTIENLTADVLPQQQSKVKGNNNEISEPEPPNNNELYQNNINEVFMALSLEQFKQVTIYLSDTDDSNKAILWLINKLLITNENISLKGSPEQLAETIRDRANQFDFELSRSDISKPVEESHFFQKAMIAEFKGLAKILRAKDNRLIPLREGMEIELDDIIMTGKDSEVVISFDPYYLNIAVFKEETTARIISLDPTVIELLDGKIFNAIDGLRPGGVYEILTPTLVSSVRGTHFTVAYSALSQEYFAATIPEPYDHKVSRIQIRSHKFPDNSGVMIEEGQQIRLLKNQTVETQMIRTIRSEPLNEGILTFKNLSGLLDNFQQRRVQGLKSYGGKNIRVSTSLVLNLDSKKTMQT